MTGTVLIRFAGERGKAYHILKLGPTNVENPPERRFQGGEEARVKLTTNALDPNCVDITFADGSFAIEVPRDFFAILDGAPESQANRMSDRPKRG